MNATFIVSFAGPDSKNLLATLAKFTHEHEGRWLSSKVNYLEGHIAANIKVTLPEENARIVKAQFMAMNELAVKIDDLPSEHHEPGKPIKLSVKSTDRLGLVCEITHLIQEFGAELIHIESHRLQVPSMGGNVFIADLDINLPEDLDLDLLISELQTIDESMIISKED